MQHCPICHMHGSVSVYLVMVKIRSYKSTTILKHFAILKVFISVMTKKLCKFLNLGLLSLSDDEAPSKSKLLVLLISSLDEFLCKFMEEDILLLK